MIPKLDRKWSRTASDPRCGPQMIPSESADGMKFGFPDFFIFFVFICFHRLNDELDKHKEKIFWQRKLELKYSSHNKFILFSLDNSEKLLEKSKLVDSNTIFQQARSTTTKVA